MSRFDDYFKALCTRIDGYRREMIAFQRELTALPALGPTNGGEGEWKRARWLQGKLREYELNDVTVLAAPDERVPDGSRPNLIIRLQGKTDRPRVWVMAHLDVVPPGERKSWESDPWEVVEKEGKLFGRGVEDNQQGLVSALFAIRALAQEGITPATDVGLVLVADEETGNAHGLDFVLQSLPDMIRPDDIVIVPDSGVADGSMIEVAEKSIVWVEFTVRGKQVHASLPNLGVNANRAASHLTVRLDEDLHRRFARKDPVFDPPESTFEPTRRDSNVPNVNTIPGEEHLFFDCRLLPEYPLEDLDAAISEVVSGVEKEFGVTIQVDHAQVAMAAPATSVDAPVVCVLDRAIRRVRGIEPKPMGIGGGTVAAVFRRSGVPAAVWSTMDDMAHQPNEYCVIDNMVEDAKVFAHVFAREAEAAD